MIDRVPKVAFMSAAVVGPLLLAFAAYSQPGYFTSQTYLAGLIFIELMVAAVWNFRHAYFPLVMLTFLLAGVDLPVGSVWTATRWLTLGVGAAVGSFIMLKDRRYHFRAFHVFALFAVLAALVSAAVSRYTNVSLLKVVSLFALFLYAGTGARLAVLGRESRFFSGLLLGCEIFVGAVAAAYLAGIEAMGNPNSLGAVMGVVAAPILLWGTLVSEEQNVRRRRAVLFMACAALIFASHARAGMVAAFMSCGLLCLALRRYKLLAQGVVVIIILTTASAILRPEAYSNAVSSLTNKVIFKGGDPNIGVLASRQSPWQAAVDAIETHFWFGTGFGTSDNGDDPSKHFDAFATATGSSTEHGSSYLAIITWVGLLGVLPYLMLLGVLARKIFQTIAWVMKTGNLLHPAVPLAFVMLAGLVHAGFEDWLFASGYYVTVFFWCMAFVFVDESPALAAANSRRAVWNTNAMRPGLSSVAPSR
jgi:O-antigen ligase